VVPSSHAGLKVVWLGNIMEDQQDASGLLYRRNRYYDPATGRFTQEDPIGLAGGLNLYGFANGDPVSYRDPYGLSADSVTYLNAEVKGYIDELRAADSEFDAGMRELENDVNFMYVFETGGLYGSPGMVWDKPVLSANRAVPGDVQTNLPIVSIMFDWARIPAVNAGIAAKGLSGGPVTRQMVVGHEVYVHAIPFSRSGGRDSCNDQPHSSPDTCGRRRHNELGARLGWPTRDGW
jgi:RHS repeat-associated protein